MPERFHCPLVLTAGNDVALDDAESHHLTHVLRLGVGAEVVLFDGAGTQADATVLALSKRGTRLRVNAVLADPPVRGRKLTLATAVPKGDRFRWMVEKATELGVERLIPLSTSRSVVDPRETKLDKMRQAVIAACKQCGRNRLMDVAGTASIRESLSQFAELGTLLMADPDGVPVGAALDAVATDRPIIGLIGPEGGWTDEERAAAKASGAVAVSLGRSILRIETAALALAARCLLR